MIWVESLTFGILVLVFCAESAPTSQFSKHPFNGTLLPRGTYGVDVSTPVSVSGFDCLKGEGFSFAIVRGFQSNGVVDPNARSTIDNARAAGVPYVDVYLFPCPQCSKSAADQVAAMVSGLSGANYGQIWLDIEGPEYWLGSYSENQKFFSELLSAASGYKSTGVYASEYEWTSIMGDYTGGSGHQLWYPHYDNNPSFSDFVPFGGWRTPAIKQYAGTTTVCDVGIDKNWY